jgi:hypothetical protein
MSIAPAWQQCLAFFGTPLVIEPFLQRRSDALLARAVAAWEKERQAARQEQRPPRPVRLFDGFWYQAGTWPAPRGVVVKAEANAEGSNRTTRRRASPAWG